MQWLYSFKDNNGIIWLACKCNSGLLSVHKIISEIYSWLCRVYMNCTSHFVLKNCFNICIQVLTGEFWAGMQDYLIPIPILDGGMLLFSPGGLPAFGTLHCSCGLQKSQGKAGRAVFPLCWLEGSTAQCSRNGNGRIRHCSEQWHRLCRARSSVLLDGSEPHLWSSLNLWWTNFTFEILSEVIFSILAS